MEAASNLEFSIGSFLVLKWDCNITPTFISQQLNVMNKLITELFRMTCMVLIFCDSVHSMFGVKKLWNLVTALHLHPEVSLHSYGTIFFISKCIFVYNNIVSESCSTISLLLHCCGLPALIQGFYVLCVCVREKERTENNSICQAFLIINVLYGVVQHVCCSFPKVNTKYNCMMISTVCKNIF